ncbi:MAG TPA: hypothetical protein VHP36_09370 [Chitinispirillaceae bacterium]|nr:hypothetical protein [Chitinispirillaceae bacterium]
MIFHSRAIPVNQNPGLSSNFRKQLIFLIIIFSVFSSNGATQVFKNFAVRSDSFNITVIDSGSFALKDRDFLLIKVYGDTIKNSSTISGCPDVINLGPDSFQFFHIATSSKALLKSSVILTLTGAVFDNAPKKIYNTDDGSKSFSFLHVAKGSSGPLITYVQTNNLASILTAENGATRMNLDSSSQYDYVASSMCHLEGDTFLVVNSIEANEIRLRKVYSNNLNINIINNVQVEKDTNVTQKQLTNCAIAFDNNDLALVVWSRGPLNLPRKMHFKFFNRSLTNSTYGILDSLICDNSFYHYDDVVVRSYGPGNFAVIFWNSSGVAMYKMFYNGGNVQKSYSQLFRKNGLKHSTSFIKNNTMAVVVNGDIDGDGKSGIEGELFEFNNGTVTSGKVLRFSNINSGTARIIDQNSTAINCAIDEKGSIGVTWRDSAMIQGCVFANRGIKYQKGYWTSMVNAFSDSSNDSICIYPLQVYTSSWNQNIWYLEDSIRFANSIAQCNTAPWRSFSSDTIYTANRFFQLRITINRKDGKDSLLTPFVDSAVTRWNVKPRFKCIDSVKIGEVANSNISFGDTLRLLSRIDSARVYLSVYDPDPSDIIRIQGGGPVETSLKTVTTGPVFKTSIKVFPIAKSDTVSTCTYSARDAKNWYASAVNLKVKTRNSPPLLSAAMVLFDSLGQPDTFNLPVSAPVVIQQNDSLDFIYSVSDTNDPLTCRGYITRIDNGFNSRFDSVSAGIVKIFRIKASDLKPVDTLNFAVSATDIDTAVNIKTKIIVNHKPLIRYCSIDADTFYQGDTVRVTINNENVIKISVNDTDCSFWDTLSLSFKVRNQLQTIKLHSTENQYSYFPQRSDTTMKIVVSDKYGKTDSIRFFVKFPWLEADTSVNHVYGNALNVLLSGPSLVIGDGIGDTVKLPLFNGGNDSMYFTSLEFKTDSRIWLSVVIIQDSGYISFSSQNYQSFRPVGLMPDSSLWLKFILSDSQMQGDGVIADTLVLRTTDPSHPIISIPVRMEYNDLPRIISVNPWFPSDIPYTGLAKKRTYRPYWFPPHSSISVSFSEPVDSVSALKGIQVYSVVDSATTGTAQPIDLHYLWSQNYTKVDLRPSYKTKSARFGILPSDGLFIPTDSLALVISTELNDKAKTPHGPNRLDYDLDFRRDSTGDTLFNMRVDSITFSLLSVTPPPGDTSVSARPEIMLLFNAPVYAASVDTALKNNRSLLVYSKFNNNTPITFDSVSVDSCKVRFRLGRTLFFGDSLWCLFRDVSVRDIMGFPSDNNDDGIPVSLFDTSLTQDNVSWGYQVKKVKVTSVTPDSGKIVRDVSPAIKINFSDSLPSDVFDRHLQNNRNLYVKSKFSADCIPFKNIEIGADHKSITFVPEVKFFSNDSIFCSFSGFTRNYRYSGTVNLPTDNNVFGALSWHFYTGNIGFYTYPNPYKPGRNRQHCAQGGPCGIWFKNLHVLKNGNRDVRIRIFSINAHPVFDSEKAGNTIHFEVGETGGKPEWLWDTRNQSGELVASGLYFYVVYDLEGNMLIKGKLIIVR